jgi:chemotaxis protein CheD
MRQLPQHAASHAGSVAVGVGELALSPPADRILVAHSLGSCIGVAILDRRTGNGGLMHCQLPSRNVFGSASTQRQLPARFADEGLSLMLRRMEIAPGAKDRFTVVLAGGSSVLDPNGHFRIGERNLTMVRKVLWSYGLMVRASDVGGDVPRTLSIHMADGRIAIWSRGRETVAIEHGECPR